MILMTAQNVYGSLENLKNMEVYLPPSTFPHRLAQGSNNLGVNNVWPTSDRLEQARRNRGSRAPRFFVGRQPFKRRLFNQN